MEQSQYGSPVIRINKPALIGKIESDVYANLKATGINEPFPTW
jgi:hypothetical protein